MSNDINALREHLFLCLAGLKDGTVSIEKAKAMSDVSQVIINSAKVEVEFAKAAGRKNSAFLGAPEAEVVPSTDLPRGILGITQHRIK